MKVRRLAKVTPACSCYSSQLCTLLCIILSLNIILTDKVYRIYPYTVVINGKSSYKAPNCFCTWLQKFIYVVKLDGLKWASIRIDLLLKPAPSGHSKVVISLLFFLLRLTSYQTRNFNGMVQHTKQAFLMEKKRGMDLFSYFVCMHTHWRPMWKSPNDQRVFM